MQLLPFVTLKFLPYFEIPSIFQDSPTQTSYIGWSWDLPRFFLDSSFGMGCVKIIADHFFSKNIFDSFLQPWPKSLYLHVHQVVEHMSYILLHLLFL